MNVRLVLALLVLVVLLAACSLLNYLENAASTPAPTFGAVSTAFPTNTPRASSTAPAASLTPAIPGVEDISSLHAGVCFNYLVAQTNRVFVIDGPFEHIAFYDEVDSSGLCRFAVPRSPFDFDSGQIIAGAVNVATGCTATTDLLEVVTDDDRQAVIIRVLWGAAGDCPYRLARPLWLSIPRPPEGYRVVFEFVPLDG